MKRSISVLLPLLLVVSSSEAFALLSAWESGSVVRGGFAGLVAEADAALAESLAESNPLFSASLTAAQPLLADFTLDATPTVIEWLPLHFRLQDGSLLRAPRGHRPARFGGILLAALESGSRCFELELLHDVFGRVFPLRLSSRQGLCNGTTAAGSADSNSRGGEEGGAFSVATLNVWNWNGDWDARLQLVADEVCDGGHDVVALQELRFSLARGQMQAEQIARECARRGRPMQFVHRPAMSYLSREDVDVEGVALFTPHAIVDVEHTVLSRNFGDSDDAQHQRAALAATVRLPSGADVTVVTTHLSLSERQQPVNAREVAAFVGELAAAAPRTPVIVVGDFNALPDSPTISSLRSEAGLQDAWDVAKVRSGPPHGNTWAAVPGDPLSKRIDLCLFRSGNADVLHVSKATLPTKMRCVNATAAVPRGICLSDHLPLTVDFVLGRSSEKDEL